MTDDFGLLPRRARQLKAWVDALDDEESSEENISVACQGIAECGSVHVEMRTQESTAAAYLGALRAVVGALRRTSSPRLVGQLFSTIFSLTAGNPKVADMLEEHLLELIPLIKEWVYALEHTFSFFELCAVLTSLVGKKVAAPQLCTAVVPPVMKMMHKVGASNDEYLLATCMMANFAHTALALKNRALWRYLDSHIDARFLADLATSNVPEVRKGDAETVLLTMYGHLDGHPAVQALVEYDVVKTFVLPYLQHAYNRGLWEERNIVCFDEDWALFCYVSRHEVLAKRLVELGMIELAVKLVTRQARDEEADSLESIWQGKASALFGLANLASHADLRREVLAVKDSLHLDGLALHQHDSLREAAERLAIELRWEMEDVGER